MNWAAAKAGCVRLRLQLLGLRIMAAVWAQMHAEDCVASLVERQRRLARKLEDDR